VGLYEQPGKITVGKMGQTGFNIDTFTSKYGLVKKGVKMVRVKPGF
jgi:hypothetical protein